MPRKSQGAAANPRAANPEVLKVDRVEPAEAADPSPPGGLGASRELSPAATAGRTEPEPSAAAEPEPSPIRVTVEVYRGDITDLPADVAVVGRYKGVEARGSARAFDQRLNSWISYAIEFGMVGSELGELFYIPTRGPRGRASGAGVARPVAPAAVFLAGLGEAGRFNREGLHFLMTNVTLAAMSLGHGIVSAPLLGFSRNEMPLEAILRGMLDGIADGLCRLRESPNLGMVLKLIHSDQDTARDILRCLRGNGARGIRGLELEVHDRRNPPIGPPPDGKPASKSSRSSRPVLFSEALQTPERMLRITISCPAQEVVAADGTTADGWRRFQYSALAESAVIPVREQQVQTYFVSHLPPRLAEASFADHETYGKLLASYLVPEDFRKLIEAGDPLTLVLDSTTALYPWEMAGFKGHRGTCFFGIDLKLARQFRTLLSAPPGLAPSVNHNLRVLLIADPAPNLPCVGARAEALAVLDAFREVEQLWRRGTAPALDLEVTVRLGPSSGPASAELAPTLAKIKNDYAFVKKNVRPCDPIELLALLINERYDIVHYAGHGVFDPKGQRLGWVFDKEHCILSAAEIFCVRQVPRLVFANACWSSALSAKETKDSEGSRRLQVSLAEAFFARGIQNYVGAGWPVDDADAATFARHFYRRALGLPADDGNGKVRPQPAPLGEALAEARRALFQARRPTWGAYQHYGQPGALLLAPPDEDAGGDGSDGR